MDRSKIRQLEDELFDQWRAEMDLEEGMLFIPDGVVCPEKFENIVFIMKEVHSKEGETQWDLRGKIHNDSDAATWNNVARWTAGLTSGFTVKWDDLDYMDLEKRTAQIHKIASMNVKKISGKPYSITKEIVQFEKKDKNFLKKQLSLYFDSFYIKYVLCCGDGVGGSFLDEFFPKSQQTTQGTWYRDNGKTVLIYYYHPNPRRNKKELYDGLAEAVQEIQQKRKIDN